MLLLYNISFLMLYLKFYTSTFINVPEINVIWRNVSLDLCLDHLPLYAYLSNKNKYV